MMSFALSVSASDWRNRAFSSSLLSSRGWGEVPARSANSVRIRSPNPWIVEIYACDRRKASSIRPNSSKRAPILSRSSAAAASV